MSDLPPQSPASLQAAELILQDERLTSDLEDAAAALLLRWAIGVAAQAASATAQCGLPMDRAAVVLAVAPVRQVARQVNDLTVCRAQLDEPDFVVRLLALIDAARQLACCP